MSEYIICPYCYNPLSQSEYVKVVRCRDCKHSDKGYWCRYFGKYGDLATVTPDGFWAWGERKDDGSNR